jgi:hypothetical protein
MVNLIIAGIDYVENVINTSDGFIILPVKYFQRMITYLADL